MNVTVEVPQENDRVGFDRLNRFRDVLGLTQSVTPVFAVGGKVGVDDGNGLSLRGCELNNSEIHV